MRKQREVFGRAWDKMISEPPDDASLQLERLEKIVADLELSIPPGTIARQFNLKSNDSKEDGQDNLRRAIEREQQRVPSSTTHAESTVSSKGPGSFNFKLISVSQSVISSLMKMDNCVIEPHAVLSTAPSQRVVSR